jgi:hypothetical protein
LAFSFAAAFEDWGCEGEIGRRAAPLNEMAWILEKFIRFFLISKAF